MARLGAAVLAALLLFALAGAPVRADSTATKKKLNTQKAKLADLRDQIAAQQAVIGQLQADANAIAQRLDRVQGQIELTQFRIIKKETEIDQAKDDLDSQQALLDRRAWVAYENGPGSSLDFLLSATSLSDLTDRLEIVDRAAQGDQDLIIDIQGLQNRLLARQGELAVLEKNLRGRRADFVVQQKALEAKLADAQAAATVLNAAQVQAESIVASLTDTYEKQKAAEELAALEAARHSGGQSIGGVFFTCPVAGSHAYGDDFGAPRYSGGFHYHAGNDIFAARGTPIVAPFPGTAEIASNGLGGLSIKVFGAVGWVYNAHMDSFTGLFPRSVGTGEQIGTVGNTGDAQGTSTHDHFEFHPNDPHAFDPLHVGPYGISMVGSAIDPWPFLNSVC